MPRIRKSVYEPSASDERLAMKLRCASKRGEEISEDHRSFLLRLYKRHPAWYRDTEATIFEMTKPFGAK